MFTIEHLMWMNAHHLSDTNFQNVSVTQFVDFALCANLAVDYQLKLKYETHWTVDFGSLRNLSDFWSRILLLVLLFELMLHNILSCWGIECNGYFHNYLFSYGWKFSLWFPFLCLTKWLLSHLNHSAFRV